MLKGVPTRCFVSSLFLAALRVAWPDQAQTQVSDQFSTSDQYDQFAVGGAHRWYDSHSDDFRKKASHCLSMLDEAETYQDAAFVLYAQAKQPGLASAQRTALRRQGMEQIRLRENKIRAFIDCFNQANRQKRQRSDQFATGGNVPPSDNPRQQPGTKSSPSGKPGDTGQRMPTDHFSTNGDKPTDQPYGSGSDKIRTEPNADQKSLPPSPEGDKNMTRTPRFPSRSKNHPRRTVFEQAIDDCFKKSVPNYRGPDWSRFSPESLRHNRVGQFHESFNLSGAAADQALHQDEAAYGKWQDRELMHDYLVGWLTHCLTDRNVLPMQDPRTSYRDFMIARERPDNVHPSRINDRFEEFGYGYRSYPLPPFWDHDKAGPPSPAR